MEIFLGGDFRWILRELGVRNGFSGRFEAPAETRRPLRRGEFVRRHLNYSRRFESIETVLRIREASHELENSIFRFSEWYEHGSCGRLEFSVSLFGPLPQFCGNKQFHAYTDVSRRCLSE